MDERLMKFSPLTEATYYILLSLCEPLHGYGVMKKVEEISGSRLHLAAGTLYGAFNNLEKNGLIEAKGVDTNNKRRKLYEITGDGKQLLRYEVNRLKEMYESGIKGLEVQNDCS